MRAVMTLTLAQVDRLGAILARIGLGLEHVDERLRLQLEHVAEGRVGPAPALCNPDLASMPMRELSERVLEILERHGARPEGLTIEAWDRDPLGTEGAINAAVRRILGPSLSEATALLYRKPELHELLALVRAALGAPHSR